MSLTQSSLEQQIQNLQKQHGIIVDAPLSPLLTECWNTHLPNHDFTYFCKSWFNVFKPLMEEFNLKNDQFELKIANAKGLYVQAVIHEKRDHLNADKNACYEASDNTLVKTYHVFRNPEKIGNQEDLRLKGFFIFNETMKRKGLASRYLQNIVGQYHQYGLSKIFIPAGDKDGPAAWSKYGWIPYKDCVDAVKRNAAQTSFVFSKKDQERLDNVANAGYDKNFINMLTHMQDIAYDTRKIHSLEQELFGIHKTQDLSYNALKKAYQALEEEITQRGTRRQKESFKNAAKTGWRALFFSNHQSHKGRIDLNMPISRRRFEHKTGITVSQILARETIRQQTTAPNIRIIHEAEKIPKNHYITTRKEAGNVR